MNSIKNILLPTDFSKNANQALVYAVKLADVMAAKLTLLHVNTLFQEDPNNPDYHFPSLEEFYHKSEDTADKNLQEMTSQHVHIKIENKVVRGFSPANEIVNFVNANKIELVVIGTHGRTALKHFLIGSVAEKVLRHVSCPVVSVSHHEHEMLTTPEIEKIIVPIDFSTFSKKALENAKELAVLFKAKIKVIHVVDDTIHPAFYIAGEDSIFDIFPDVKEKTMKSLKELLPEDDNILSEDGLVIREGKPHVEIVKFADEENADLIVMATHGLSGIEHLLLGSVTEKVIRKARCPVFAIKPINQN